MNFFENYKKYFLIAGFVIITIVLGYALYAIFFKPSLDTGNTSGQNTDTDQNTDTGFPAAGQTTGQTTVSSSTIDSNLPENQGGGSAPADSVARGGKTSAPELNNMAGLGATLASNGSDVQMYDTGSNKFYRIDKNGEAKEMSDKVFYNVEKVTWSPVKDKAIIEYPDGANIIYDFTAKKQITLPNHWKDFDYSDNGKQIVMKSIGLDPENRWLAIANEDGSNVRTIEPLGDKDETVYPDWSPNNQMVAMFTEGADFNRQDLYFVGLNNENFKSTVIEGRGFQPKWSTDGEQLMYSVYSSDNDMKPTLWIVNANSDDIGSGRKMLNIDTWAEKCAFSADQEVFCGVPDQLEAGAGIFPELANSTKDLLYKINTTTGVKKLIAIPDGDYAMSNLMVSDNGYYLYFTDEKTKLVHKIKLK